jgi:hypothetical protein
MWQDNAPESLRQGTWWKPEKPRSALRENRTRHDFIMVFAHAIGVGRSGRSGRNSLRWTPCSAGNRNILPKCSTMAFQGRRQVVFRQHGGLGRPPYGSLAIPLKCYRNSTHKIRNPKQILSTKSQCSKPCTGGFRPQPPSRSRNDTGRRRAPMAVCRQCNEPSRDNTSTERRTGGSVIWFLDFRFVSDFVLRISDFPLQRFVQGIF